MDDYAICVTETLMRTYIVRADTFEAAMQRVEEAVEQSKIVLDADDYDGRTIEPSERWKNGKVPGDVDVSYYCRLE